MTSEKTYQKSFIIQAEPEAVFDVLGGVPDPLQPMKQGSLLELHVISGRPGVFGFQQQARFHFGPLDLIMIETLKACDRPNLMRVEQLPQSLQRHDPNERDIPFLDSMIEDLDLAFRDSFGANPPVTELTFELLGDEQHTNLSISVVQKNETKIGWRHNRKWNKSVRAEVDAIADRIARSVQVQ